MERFAAIWSTENGQINWQAAEELYANEDDLVFFVPWQPRAGYVGWNSFKEGVQQNVFDGLKRLDLKINDDVEVTRRGDVAWTTSTGRVELDYQDGRSVKADGRMTMIWQQQDGSWQLIHEHFSVPVNAQ
ncbi:YybH family protein [Myxosarcina sp. GI1(2024)]